MKSEIALRPSYWASVSGGKDSLFMLNLILRNPERYPLDGVVHFEAGYLNDVIRTKWLKVLEKMEAEQQLSVFGGLL